jgi:hypothetical protein
LWDGCDNGDSSKRWTLSPPTLDIHISFLGHRGFWVLTLKNGRLSSSMCCMAWLAKGTDGPPLIVLHVFYR